MKRIGAIFAFIILVGCSGSSGPSKDGAQYLRIIAPTNRALPRFQSELSSLGPHPASSAAAKVAGPLITVIQAVDRDLLRAPWPPNVRDDIKSEVVADAAITTDLSVAGTRPNWERQLMSDESKAGRAARAVRGDLHLSRG